MRALANEGTFSIGTIRRWRHLEASNGARDFGVFLQIGRKIYIDIENLEKWIASGVSAVQGRAA